jgi:hypothetical protein
MESEPGFYRKSVGKISSSILLWICFYHLILLQTVGGSFGFDLGFVNKKIQGLWCITWGFCFVVLIHDLCSVMS